MCSVLNCWLRIVLTLMACLPRAIGHHSLKKILKRCSSELVLRLGCVYTCISVGAYICVCACVHTYVCVSVCIMYIRTYVLCVCTCVCSVYVYVRVCISIYCVCTCLYMYASLCVHVCLCGEDRFCITGYFQKF